MYYWSGNGKSTEGYTLFHAAEKNNKELQAKGKGASMVSITLSVLSDTGGIIVNH